MRVLVWLLCHMRVPSLLIGSELRIRPEDIENFCEAIRNEDDSEQKEKVENGLSCLKSVDISERLDSKDIEILMPNIPSIKMLKINVEEPKSRCCKYFQRMQGT